MRTYAKSALEAMVLTSLAILALCLWLAPLPAYAHNTETNVSTNSAETVYPGIGTASSWECRYDGAGTLTLTGPYPFQALDSESTLQDLFDVPEEVTSEANTLVINGFTDSFHVFFYNRFKLPNVRTLILDGDVSYHHEEEADCPIEKIITREGSSVSLYMTEGSSSGLTDVFYTMESLKTVDVQGNLYIGYFVGCTNLKNVHIANWAYPLSENGSALRFWGDTTLESVVVDQVTDGGWRAGYHAFRGCTSLTDLRINGALKEVGGYSFYGCESLESFPDLSQVEKISNHAFRDCKKLKSVDVSATVELNGYYIFAGCEELERVHLAHTGKIFVSELCYQCTNLNSFVIDTMDAPATMLDCDFQGCKNLQTLQMPKGYDKIGQGEFYGCASLKRIPTLENLSDASVASIPSGAHSEMFDGCASLTEVVFPESLVISTSVSSSQYAFVNSLKFRGCTSLKRVVLPASLGWDYSDIGSRVTFQDCTSLTEIQFPKYIKTLRGTAFEGCDSLQCITLPESVESIYALTENNSIRTVFFTGDCPSCIKNGSTTSIFGENASVRCYYLTGNESWEEFLADETAVGKKYPGIEWASCQEGQIGFEPDEEIVDVSDEDSTANYICDPKVIQFHYSASNGKRRQYSFVYSDNWFFKNENGIDFHRELALASLSAAMSGYSDIRKIGTTTAWTAKLAADDYSRAYNIHELYSSLKFSGPEFYNYDKPLNDASDKVAFSIAHKYVNAGETQDDLTQGEDTVIAIVVRGGCYGAEWASDFNVVNGTDYDSDHYGFMKAAEEVEERVNAYVKALAERDTGIRGQLKIWITGYSRGSAVANKVAHDINYNGVGGREIHTGNVYAYTFATPNIANRDFSGSPANISYHYYGKDADIFNIVSPADLVPKAPVYDWGYGRYGRTLYLPTDNYDGLWAQYETLSGKKLTQTEWISSGGIHGDQRSLIDEAERLVKLIAPDRIGYRTTLQDPLWKLFYNMNQKPSDALNSLDEAFNEIRDIAQERADQNPAFAPAIVTFFEALTLLKSSSGNVLRAHEPEHYYAHLFMDKLYSLDDFNETVPLNRLIIRGWDPDNPHHVLVIYKNGTEVGSIRGGAIWTDQNVTCDETGAVTSRDQTVNIAGAAEGTYYVELFDPNCTIELSSDTEETVSLELEQINEDYAVEKSEARENIAIEGGNTVTITDEDFANIKEEPAQPAASDAPTAPTVPTASAVPTAPKATAIKHLTAKKGKIIVKWKKASGATGYQIQYSPKKSFKSKTKTVTIKKASVTSKTIKKLKRKKMYYFRIRTYKSVNGTKVFSAWSKTKKAKTR